MTVNAMAQELDSHRWKERLLILYSPDLEDKSYQQQLEVFRKAAKGLKERKLVVYTLLPNSYIKGLQSTKKQRASSRPVTDFAIELIGLDGGRKLFSKKTVTIQELFALIDRMPMRRREMEKGR
jgi:3-deoxy-D-arabino-heptulosonate 7-phosphate (DAHP) synthase